MSLLRKYSKKDITIISICCGIFLLLGFMAVDYGLDAFAFMPLVILGIMLLFAQYYNSVFFVAFLTPFSIFFRNTDLSITVPSEPMLVLIMLIFIWEYSYCKHYDLKLLKHPISLAVIVSLVWIAISTIFSVDFVVSVKHLIARLFFVIPCFFLMLIVFKDYKKMLWFVASYGFALSIVIVITSIKHMLVGFDHNAGNFIMEPFYSDHTIYGAAIGLFTPISFYYLFASKKLYDNKWLRFLFVWICVWLSIGLVLCFARATWLSVIAAIGVYVLVKLKIKFKYLVYTGLALGLVLLLSWSSLMQMMESNNQDSSANITEHIKSMTNITTDASNTERLNRWSCAIRMAQERPIVGWGFGTYQFVYGSFQKWAETTVISTNEGTLGNAHSEYIGPLCETGIPGCLTIVFIFGITIYYGLRVYHKTKEKHIANLSLFITLSLITYYIHGLMNNFLDTDKLSVPFWAFTAMIVALDYYQEKKADTEPNTKTVAESTTK